jgi:hypothetical protein
MNLSEVLHALVDQARFGADQTDDTYGKLNAHAAIDAVAAAASWPDGTVFEAPVPAITTPIPQGLDYAKLAEAIVAAQTAGAAAAAALAPVEPAPADPVAPTPPDVQPAPVA